MNLPALHLPKLLHATYRHTIIQSPELLLYQITYLPALSLAPIHKPYQSYCLSTLHLPTYLTPTCNLSSLDEEGEHFRRDTERQALFQLEKAKTKPGKSCQQVSLLSRSVRWCQPDQPGHSFRLELHTTIIGLFSSKVSHGLFRSV